MAEQADKQLLPPQLGSASAQQQARLRLLEKRLTAFPSESSREALQAVSAPNAVNPSQDGHSGSSFVPESSLSGDAPSQENFDRSELTPDQKRRKLSSSGAAATGVADATHFGPNHPALRAAAAGAAGQPAALKRAVSGASPLAPDSTPPASKQPVTGELSSLFGGCTDRDSLARAPTADACPSTAPTSLQAPTLRRPASRRRRASRRTTRCATCLEPSPPPDLRTRTAARVRLPPARQARAASKISASTFRSC